MSWPAARYHRWAGDPAPRVPRSKDPVEEP